MTAKRVNNQQRKHAEVKKEGNIGIKKKVGIGVKSVAPRKMRDAESVKRSFAEFFRPGYADRSLRDAQTLLSVH